MGQCSYCKYLASTVDGVVKHMIECPRAVTDEDEVRRREALYHLGWRAGRGGADGIGSNLKEHRFFGICFEADPTFQLGVANGNCAMEEAENGWNPMTDGGQW